LDGSPAGGSSCAACPAGSYAGSAGAGGVCMRDRIGMDFGPLLSQSPALSSFLGKSLALLLASYINHIHCLHTRACTRSISFNLCPLCIIVSPLFLYLAFTHTEARRGLTWLEPFPLRYLIFHLFCPFSLHPLTLALPLINDSGVESNTNACSSDNLHTRGGAMPPRLTPLGGPPRGWRFLTHFARRV
jgi:hypothetical protein